MDFEKEARRIIESLRDRNDVYLYGVKEVEVALQQAHREGFEECANLVADRLKPLGSISDEIRSLRPEKE